MRAQGSRAADTAAALAQIDLLIGVDTSVAHLGGAMGRPTWVLLPFIADWRWGLQEANSLWYSSVSLWRQPKSRDWTSVTAAVATALLEKAASLKAAARQY